MKQLWIVGVTFTMSMGMAITASAAGDAAAGKKIFAMCASCHGANGAGNKVMNAPLIAGQQEWYIVRQISNFKAGIRGAHAKDVHGKTMRGMAGMLRTDKAVNDVAAYVASLSPVAAAVTIKADAAAGKASFGICQGCHGPTGAGNKAMNAPRLANQHDWYIVRQIKNFKAGIRGAHAKDTFGKHMDGMARTLPTDAAIKNVAAYIQTLK